MMKYTKIRYSVTNLQCEPADFYSPKWGFFFFMDSMCSICFMLPQKDKEGHTVVTQIKEIA